MLKSRRSREWLVLTLGVCWAGWSCTRLTEVDWSRIGTDDEGQGGEVAAQGGQPGVEEGGAPPSEGGVGGAIEEGGAAGESGSGPLAGGGGMAGSAGAAGSGVGGGGAAGMGGGGTGGIGGMGGGSGGEGPVVIIGGAAAIAGAIVLYDGGADAANGNYNGRIGLEQRCQTAKTALSLPHAKSAAFISVDGTDTLYDLPQNREVPKDKQIVSKTGVLLAENWVGLLGEALLPGRPNVSLKTAGVVPASAKRWLSGSTATGAFDTNGACDGWTKSTYDTIVQGRYGAVNTVTAKWLSDLRVACDVGESHVLCLAFP